MTEEDEAQLRRMGRHDLVGYGGRVYKGLGSAGACGKAKAGQVGGDHYKKFKIQPWDIIDEYELSFYEGNVLKYLLRSKGDKVEDLKKARHYLDKVIEDLL